MNQSDLQLNAADELGFLLAQIADLEARATKIKDEMKDAASKGGPKVIEGELYKATYSESNRETFDKAKFIKMFGEDNYKNFTKVSAVFTVKVTSR